MRQETIQTAGKFGFRVASTNFVGVVLKTNHLLTTPPTNLEEASDICGGLLLLRWQVIASQMLRVGKRRKRQQSQQQQQIPSPVALGSPEQLDAPIDNHHQKTTRTPKPLNQSNNIMAIKSRTHGSVVTTPSTVHSPEWNIQSSTSTADHHGVTLLSSSSSPSRQVRVLFSEETEPATSPLPTSSSSEPMSLSSPPREWNEHHASKMENDVLRGNLSMDSSLTSTSSLEESENSSTLMSNHPSVPKHRYKIVLWYWSRPKAMIFVLTAMGLTFSTLTALLSLSIGQPRDDLYTETALRSRFLVPRRVHHSKDQATVSLTALALGQQTAIETVRVPRDNEPKLRRKLHGKKHAGKRQAPLEFITPVSVPADWPSSDKLLRTFPYYSNYNRQGSASTAPRVTYLYDPQLSSQHPPKRHVTQYPADFTDQTQLYSVLDSRDERIKGMELRKPFAEGECVPMSDWQTTFHPSCNAVHELGLAQIGANPEMEFDLFGKKGFWRHAWKVQRKHSKDVFALKTLKIQHNFEEAHFLHDRIDAVAMERLTGSPHVIDVFGFCGHSVYTEYADGERLGAVADRARKRFLATLQMAKDIAEGLADVHGIDGDDKVSFVHLDVNPANIVIVGDKLKLNDFNIGIIRRWNTTSNTPCGFPAQFPNPQWRSPEEARNENFLTEKVDVFSMGHIFFRLISGAEPWNRLEPGGKPSKAEVNVKVQQGILPTIPESVLQSTDPEIVAIRQVMLRCYEKDPNDRPSAREIANTLERELNRLKSIGS